MDLPPAWNQTCICGRTFSLQQAYTYHKRSCQKTKKRLSTALEKAKEAWMVRKRRKTDPNAEVAAQAPGSPPGLLKPVPLQGPSTLEVRLSIRFFLSDSKPSARVTFPLGLMT